MASITINPQDARRIAKSVRVSERIDAVSAGRRWAGQPAPQPVKIIAAAGGAGWYTAKIWKPPAAKIDVTAALTQATLGSTGADCYFGNLSEQGKSTHDLTNAANTATTLFFGFRWGTATDGKPIYLASGFYLEDCT